MGAVGPLLPRLLDLDSAAAYLGISVWTFAEWERAGVVSRVHAPLRRRLYDRVQLDQLVDEWTQRAEGVEKVSR